MPSPLHPQQWPRKVLLEDPPPPGTGLAPAAASSCSKHPQSKVTSTSDVREALRNVAGKPVRSDKKLHDEIGNAVGCVQHLPYPPPSALREERNKSIWRLPCSLVIKQRDGRRGRRKSWARERSCDEDHAIATCPARSQSGQKAEFRASQVRGQPTYLREKPSVSLTLATSTKGHSILQQRKAGYSSTRGQRVTAMSTPRHPTKTTDRLLLPPPKERRVTAAGTSRSAARAIGDNRSH